MSNVIEDKHLHPRDRLFRDTFTPAEHLSFWTLLITAVVLFAFADPRSFWILGFLLIVGGFCPVVLKTHEHTHPFFIDMLWPRFWLMTSPVWLLGIQFALGFIQQPIQAFEFDGQTLQMIESGRQWLPATVSVPTTWLTVLGLGSAYIVALNLFIIPKSLAYFERILPKLCLIASLIGVFGYLQKVAELDRSILTKGTGQNDFFAFFPYDGHWAAFAMLWSAVCIAMALLSTRYNDSGNFINSTGPWYLTGATILGSTGLIIEARWPAAILLLCFASLLLLVAVHFIKIRSDKHHASISTLCGLISVGAYACGIYRIFQGGAYIEQSSELRRAALEMFKDRIFFGWGLDSFPHLIPYYADDLLLTARHESANSDLLQHLAEFGLLGSLLFPAILVYLIIRYLRLKKNILMTNHMLIGCAAVLALAVVDSPFMSPTVFFSFFIILFSALRWADLSRIDIDEVDAAERTQLVTPESLRGVPQFKGEHKYKEK